jgi:predicted P-loop ATPase
LDTLAWDGVARIDEWLTTYGGAAASPYVRAVGALMLIAGVKRLRQPGCKFDEMLVLESEQGMNKSSALAVLATRPDWFTDSLPLDADPKEVIEQLSGKWIVEAAELKGMRRGDVEHLKSFLSRQVDRARMSYGRTPSEVPRQCTFLGTTNSETYLRDGTGNRRYWPVKVAKFDIDRLKEDVDQLWAEAAAREASGESIRLPEDLYPAAALEQDRRIVDDPWLGLFESNLIECPTGRILTEDAWAVVNIPTGQRTQDHNSRLGDAMKALKWERKKFNLDGRKRWFYARGTLVEQKRRVIIERSIDNGLSIYYEDGGVVGLDDGVPF